jgi:hypothetical protein
MNRYHDDETINREIHLDMLAAEAADLKAGFPVTRWACDCGASHSRGTINGVAHRCLRCGFIGVGGTLDCFGGD